MVEGPLRRPSAIAAALILALSLLPQSSQAQASKKPLTKNEVIGFLESGVESKWIEDQARQYGISFEMTRETEKQLREAGATEELLRTLRRLAPRPPPPPRQTVTTPPAPSSGPPVLLIEAIPGGAQVYIDDEPKGTTSSQGRLKLSQLAPGEHTVRLSVGGHRDYEQHVSLVAGQTVQVTASLEAATPAARTETGTGLGVVLTKTETPPSGQAAYLGVEFAPSQPPGVKGVVISGAQPGSPAEQAGLRPYNIILEVAGQAVTSPQGLQQIVLGHRAGETVDITVYDGTQTLTKRVQLGSRPADVSSPQEPANAGTKSAQVLGAGTSSGQPPAPNPNVAYFPVAHDHGSAGSEYCFGWMAMGNGMIQYRSTNGIHSFEFPLSSVKEAKKNSVYLVAIGGFHIRMKKGANYNFVVINSAGQFQPPDALLEAIDRAIGKD